MNDLPIRLCCPRCSREIVVAFGDLKGSRFSCPECGAEIPVTEEQIDAAVERRLRAERKAMKPKLGGF